MTARGKWQGMMTIVRFNWPVYAVALFATLAAWAGVLLIPGTLAKLACASALLGASYFLIGSLLVSHLIYDRSDLYRWRWLDRALEGALKRDFILCHSGFDEASRALKGKFHEVRWIVLDHYDPSKMTEPSIHRARRLFPATPGTLPARHDAWPAGDQSAEVVFGLLAIHELRTEDELSKWFSEGARILRKGGRIVIVEHLRNLPNFLAFGPGALHFHSRGTWRQAWERAGLRVIDEFPITPWLRAFILSRP